MENKKHRRRREYYDHGVRHVRSDDIKWRAVCLPTVLYLIVGIALMLFLIGVDYGVSHNAVQNWENSRDMANIYNSLSDTQRAKLASTISQDYKLDDNYRIVIGEYPTRKAGQFQCCLDFLKKWGWLVALLWLSGSIYFAYANNRDDRYFISDFPDSPFHGWLLPALTFVVWPFYLYERKIEIPRWEKETGYRPWSTTVVEDLTESLARKEKYFEPLEKFIRYCKNEEYHRVYLRRQELDEKIQQLENEEIRLDAALSQCRILLMQEKAKRIQQEQENLSVVEHTPEEIAKIWSNLQGINGVTKIIIPDRDSEELHIVIKARVKVCEKIFDLGDFLITIYACGLWTCYATRAAHAPQLLDDYPNLCDSNCRESRLTTETQEAVTKHLKDGDIATAVELISTSLHYGTMSVLGNQISQYFKQVISPAEA